MDLTAIIKELVDERDLVDSAILSIEKIAAQRGKRRGRPPAWMKLLSAPASGKKKRGRPPGKKNTTK
jgi:hypothetical protein